AFSHGPESASRHSDESSAAPIAPGPSIREIGVTQTAPSGRVSSNGSRADSMFETSGGLIMGTLAYMSPEQARGEPATTASDLFSFGVLIQELFTRRHPHPEHIDGAALLDRVQRGVTDDPVGVPSDLAGLIRRLTSPSPAQRPTAVDAAERLQWIAEKP